MTVSFCSCGSDEPDPNNGTVVKPTTDVPDPTGTIQLSMRNDDDTSLDGLYISEDNNFHGDWRIASAGQVKGLGNVSSIPLSGWAGKMSVTPGTGYICYNKYSGEFMRLFVTEYTLAAGTEGIIGAKVKYQKPFKGLDEAITPDMTQVTLDPAGAMQQVTFKNSTFIPFDVTSSEAWCQVKKASTRSESFLTDAIVIQCEPTYSSSAKTTVVKVKNLFGTTTEIKVSLPGRGEFIDISKTEYTFGCSEQNQSASTGIFTNVEPKDIKITASESWLSGAITDNEYQATRKVRWIEDQPLSRALLENPVNKTLKIDCEPYMGRDPRKATLTLSYGKVSQTINVTQTGTDFAMSKNTVEFGASDNLTQQVSFTCQDGFDATKLYAKAQDGSTWCSVSSVKNYYERVLSFTALANPYPNSRSAKFDIYYKSGTSEGLKLTTISVSQKGREFKDEKIYFQRTASNYTLIWPVPEGEKVYSSEDWCTASKSGDNLIIRATATTNNRSAVITFSYCNAKIYISQSKYAVDDEYSESGVTGKIVLMEAGEGKIAKLLDGNRAWSTEKVENSGARSETDGESNTKAIMAIPGWQDLYPAFALVNTLNSDGITGWYLPASQEATHASITAKLKLTSLLPNSTSSYPWTSTEFSSYKAYCFYGSKTYNYYKDEKHAVVAVHKFSYDFNKK